MEDDIPMLKHEVNTTFEAMTHWIESAGLSLATMKTDVVLFTHYYRFSPSSFHLKGEQIRLCTPCKYLWLRFEGKLTFKGHAKRTATKAERIVASISRLMSNLGAERG